MDGCSRNLEKDYTWRKQPPQTKYVLGMVNPKSGYICTAFLIFRMGTAKTTEDIQGREVFKYQNCSDVYFYILKKLRVNCAKKAEQIRMAYIYDRLSLNYIRRVNKNKVMLRIRILINNKDNSSSVALPEIEYGRCFAFLRMHGVNSDSNAVEVLKKVIYYKQLGLSV